MQTISCQQFGSQQQSRYTLPDSVARFKKPYNVCTSDWTPFVKCSGIDNQAQYTGFQIDLWREVARDLGWADDDYFFSCMDWDPMLEDLVIPNGNCTLAAAGIDISLTNVVTGIKFSVPIYKNGLQVMVASHVETGGTWAFAEAFHWSVWLMFALTSVAVSLLVTAIKFATVRNKANVKGIRGWSWYCVGKMVQVVTHTGDPRAWASRTLVLAYAFLVLIIVHLFTGSTAAKMTMRKLANDISKKEDLPGKKVETWEPYIGLMRKYSVDADGLPWDTDEDTDAMAANLRSHKYQALVLDTPVVQYLAAHAPNCDLFPVGDPFESYSLAIAFSNNAPNEFVQSVSASIVRLQTMSALLDELEYAYMKGGNHDSNTGSNASTCANVGGSTSVSAGHGSTTQIQMKQVVGLWYILAGAFCLALLVILEQHIMHSRLHKRVKQLLCWPAKHAAVQPGPPSAASSKNGSAHVCSSSDGTPELITAVVAVVKSDLTKQQVRDMAKPQQANGQRQGLQPVVHDNTNCIASIRQQPDLLKSSGSDMRSDETQQPTKAAAGAATPARAVSEAASAGACDTDAAATTAAIAAAGSWLSDTDGSIAGNGVLTLSNAGGVMQHTTW